jgi:hypothetical protein
MRSMRVDGALSCSSAWRVWPSSCPVTGRPRASWKPFTAYSNEMPAMPSITPGEKPARSSRTWAWNTVPSNFSSAACVPGRAWPARPDPRLSAFPDPGRPAAPATAIAMVPTRKPFKRVVFCTVLRSATKLGSQRETQQAQLISTAAAWGGMEAIRIGCSGWNYRHWRGPFYAEKLPQKRLVSAIMPIRSAPWSSTPAFIACRPARPFAKWRDQAPPGFRYAVKAPRFITHMKKLLDCADPVHEFIEARPQSRRHARAVAPTRCRRDWQLIGRGTERSSTAAARPRHVLEFRRRAGSNAAVLAQL